MSSDELNGKSGKVKVMYVRQDDGNTRDRKPAGRGKRKDDRYARQERPAERKWQGSDGSRNRSPVWGQRTNASERDRAAERGYQRKTDSAEPGEQDADFSPWSSSSRVKGRLAQQGEDETRCDHGGISGNSEIDPDVLRRQRAEETRVYGENACQSLFAHRPDSIVRGWFLQEVTPRFRDALRWMAANRKAYHIVESEELEKVSATEHHGGVCFLIKKRVGISVNSWLRQAPEQDCVLAVEDVSNPHNLGAIMRSCAHFGIKGMLVQDVATLESGAAVRTAEGGAEYVQAISGDDFISALQQFRKAGYSIVGTSSHKGTLLLKTRLPKKMVLLLGQERGGMSAEALSLAGLRIVIGGAGHVESLNVSVAAGILLAEWWRQQGQGNS